jgi:hypothetical protein
MAYDYSRRSACIRSGLSHAKLCGTKSGIPIGRPEPELPPEFAVYYDLMQSGEITKVEFARLLQIGRATAYRWIMQYEKSRS